MAKFTDVSKLDDFYNNTVKTKTGLQKGDFAELAGAYRTLRTNIISNNTATLAAGKVEQQLGTEQKKRNKVCILLLIVTMKVTSVFKKLLCG